MRAVAHLIIVLSIVLLAITGVVLLTPESVKHQISATVTGLISNKPAEVPPASEAPKAETAVKPAVVVVNRNRAAAPGQLKTSLPAPAKAWPFPTAADVRAGVSRATVVQKFGQPNTLVTLADGGRLMECFIYMHKPSHQTTVVMLVNSTVVSAQTAGE